MSQYEPMITSGSDKGKPNSGTANLTRRLFVETGLGFYEVASSAGNPESFHYAIAADGETKVCRIVGPYAPPSPRFNAAEVKIANSPSRIHSTGKSSYGCKLSLLVPDYVWMADLNFYAGNKIKFIDERGSVFIGVLPSSMEIQRFDGGKVFKVSFDTVLTKKDQDDRLSSIKFTDISIGYEQLSIVIDSYSLPSAEGVWSFSYNGGTVTGNAVIYQYHTPYLMLVRMKSAMMDAGLGAYFDFSSPSENNPELVLKSKEDGISNDFTFSHSLDSGGFITETQTESTGAHWAKPFIESTARHGITAVYDRYGRPVYLFEPNRAAKRSEVMVFVSRLIRYLDRVLGA